MKKCILFTCLFLLLIGSSRAESEGEKIVSGTVKDGYALLTDLTKIFEEIVTKGSGLGSANERLNKSIIDAAVSFQAGTINPVFNHRLKRLLLIYKLILTPITPENNIWEIVIRKELNNFVLDTTGETWVWKLKNPEAIHTLANAMEEEFISLWPYLDTLPQRAELKKKFGKSMLLPPPPPPKKNAPDQKDKVSEDLPPPPPPAG